jgi:hypothetical protein
MARKEKPAPRSKQLRRPNEPAISAQELADDCGVSLRQRSGESDEEKAAVPRSRKKLRRPDGPAIPAQELADDIGVSLQQVYRGCESGQIRGFRLGKRWIIPRSERARLLSLAPAE